MFWSIYRSEVFYIARFIIMILNTYWNNTSWVTFFPPCLPSPSTVVFTFGTWHNRNPVSLRMWKQNDITELLPWGCRLKEEKVVNAFREGLFFSFLGGVGVWSLDLEMFLQGVNSKTQRNGLSLRRVFRGDNQTCRTLLTGKMSCCGGRDGGGKKPKRVQATRDIQQQLS